jgi:hypothetical protein
VRSFLSPFFFLLQSLGCAVFAVEKKKKRSCLEFSAVDTCEIRNLHVPTR